MLVLTRRQSETIKIGDDITVTIVKVAGNIVRVGIDAPRAVTIIRGELERFDAQGTVHDAGNHQ